MRSPVSSFGFHHSFGFRHSDLRIAVCQKADQGTAEGGRSWVGLWKAPFRFSACIGTMNPSESCHRYGVRLQAAGTG